MTQTEMENLKKGQKLYTGWCREDDAYVSEVTYLGRQPKSGKAKLQGKYSTHNDTEAQLLQHYYVTYAEAAAVALREAEEQMENAKKALAAARKLMEVK